MALLPLGLHKETQGAYYVQPCPGFDLLACCQVDLEKARKRYVSYGPCAGLSHRADEAASLVNQLDKK